MYFFYFRYPSKYQEVEVIQVIHIEVDHLVGKLRREVHNKEEEALDH